MVGERECAPVVDADHLESAVAAQQALVGGGDGELGRGGDPPVERAQLGRLRWRCRLPCAGSSQTRDRRCPRGDNRLSRTSMLVDMRIPSERSSQWRVGPRPGLRRAARGDRLGRARARPPALRERAGRARSASAATPVREALVRLRDERLVAIVPQLGTFVTLISTDARRRRRLRARGARVQRHPPGRPSAPPSATSRSCRPTWPPRTGPSRPATPRRSTVSTRRCTAPSASSAAARSPGRSAGAPTATSTACGGSACPSPATSARWSTEHRAVVAAVADHDAGSRGDRAAPPPAHGPVEPAQHPRRPPRLLRGALAMAVDRSRRRSEYRPSCAASCTS